jgi:hypothetical protein
MASGGTITADVGLWLVVPRHGRVELTATFSYRCDDPYAIRVAFDTGADEPVQWMFARDLLADGLYHHAGDGDVRFWPTTSLHPDVLNVSLSSPDGQALFQAPLAEVTSFLLRTFEAVPPGQEGDNVDLDHELENLFHHG